MFGLSALLGRVTGQATSNSGSIGRFTSTRALKNVLAARAEAGTLHVFTTSSGIPNPKVQPNKA